MEIEIRPEWGKKGNYGRGLGVVYVDGEDVNTELARMGHARVYGEEI